MRRRRRAYDSNNGETSNSVASGVPVVLGWFFGIPEIEDNWQVQIHQVAFLLRPLYQGCVPEASPEYTGAPVSYRGNGTKLGASGDVWSTRWHSYRLFMRITL
jgi:hypothetical protein